MNTYIFIYDDFANFEVALSALFMKAKGEIITVALEKREYVSEEGFKFLPHKILKNVKPEDIDLFIIPGGNYNSIYGNKKIYEFITKLYELNKCIAAICSGTIQIAKAGILDGKKFTTSMPIDEHSEFKKGIFLDENVVVDEKIITAKGNGYVDFAIEIGKVMDIYEDKDDLRETENYFKYFK